MITRRRKKNNDDDDKMYGIFSCIFAPIQQTLLWKIKTMTSPHLHFQNKNGKQQDQFDTYT